MQTIDFTTAPTLVIESKRKLIDLLPKLVKDNRLIQFRRNFSLYYTENTFAFQR